MKSVIGNEILCTFLFIYSCKVFNYQMMGSLYISSASVIRLDGRKYWKSRLLQKDSSVESMF